MRKNCGFSNCYLEGPRGEKDAIEVRKTKTLPPDRKALVIDAYSFGKYILDFEIPMRGTGLTGPSVILAFGYKFRDLGTILNLTKQEVVKVPLNKNGEAREINLEDNSDFIILENGIYKLEYYFLGSISSDMAFFTELLRNGEALDGTTISKYLVTNTDSDFYGACVTTLEANDN